MSDKKYDPTWSGYMGDYLRGNVGINQLKPQHEFFDAIGLEKQLRDNERVIILLTPPEARIVLDELRNNGISYSRDAYSFVSSYIGNIREASYVAELLREFNFKFGITATEYVAANGSVMIKLSGYAGLRHRLNATHYLANNGKLIGMGIGQRGLNAATIDGMRYTFIAAVGFRVLQLIFQNDYDLYNFIGDITMDVAKLGVASFIAWGGGSTVIAAAAALSIGASPLIVGVVVFVLGFGIAYGLNYIDEKFHISEKLIEKMREVKNQPEGDKYWKGNR
ncbi:hypothetical protein K6U37_12645 [Vibrio parahaemolyticus]|uniref:hypothetical protein n=1 Tax=Vibrio parahaemolyticus TaxID=670 RepID=UPI001EEB3755|nr:hypothetical protein [Vibrio parahaemolyticus]MCG6489799.1 hypothetical protein [Vibrio parahaemolyticus]